MKLVQKIIKTLNRYQMLKKDDRVLVGVSGGPDSVFLLHVLKNLRSRFGIKLYVAHIDHALRGRQSANDAKFVKRFSKSLGIKAAFAKLKPYKQKAGLSTEEIFREKRYEFFEKTARRFKANVIATAHTLDDQAETVLMRIIKGSSLKGIVGIHPVRRTGKVKFIRPLIELEKEEMLAFLKQKKISFRVDSTNAENRFLRNRIRNKILPYLEKINPRLKRSLFNLSESLREDFEFIEEEKKKKRNLIKKKQSIYYIKLSDIIRQPKALRREIIREVLKDMGANIKKLTFRHWIDLDNFIRVTEAGKSLDLPGCVQIRKNKDCLAFIKKRCISP